MVIMEAHNVPIATNQTFAGNKTNKTMTIIASKIFAATLTMPVISSRFFIYADELNGVENVTTKKFKKTTIKRIFTDLTNVSGIFSNNSNLEIAIPAMARIITPKTPHATTEEA